MYAPTKYVLRVCFIVFSIIITIKHFSFRLPENQQTNRLISPILLNELLQHFISDGQCLFPTLYGVVYSSTCIAQFRTVHYSLEKLSHISSIFELYLYTNISNCKEWLLKWKLWQSSLFQNLKSIWLNISDKPSHARIYAVIMWKTQGKKMPLCLFLLEQQLELTYVYLSVNCSHGTTI